MTLLATSPSLQIIHFPKTCPSSSQLHEDLTGAVEQLTLWNAVDRTSHMSDGLLVACVVLQVFGERDSISAELCRIIDIFHVQLAQGQARDATPAFPTEQVHELQDERVIVHDEMEEGSASSDLQQTNGHLSAMAGPRGR